MALSHESVSTLNITQADLLAFHNSHFSPVSTDHFKTHFLGPVDDDTYEEEDDELGYYEDGVKRTLSDEQIAMFRHSEIQAILRDRRRAAEDESSRAPIIEPIEPVIQVVEEEVEVSTPSADSAISQSEAIENSQKVKAKGKQGRGQQQKKGHFKQHVKPDLRKRTWDKVERGMESLDYGEESSQPTRGTTLGAQRRKISYDDV